MNVLREIKNGIAPVVDLVYPPRCPLCGDGMAAQDGLCGTCWSELVIPGEPCCALCQRPFDSEALSPDAICAPCLAAPPVHDGIAAATLYNEPSRKLVLAFKHGGRIALAPMLARLIAARIPPMAEPWLVVPVPLHRWRLWRRGFNQSALLAREVSRRIDGELALDALSRNKHTPLLGGLGKKARRRALAGAIELTVRGRSRVEGRDVILIDDVLTSGATSDTCVSVLKRGGARRVMVGCFARVLDEAMPPRRAVETETPGAEAPGVT